jgi:hypothetical protein
MSMKQTSSAAEIDTQTDQSINEIVPDPIIEDFKKLNDKMDQVILKIKGRKNKKK